MTVEHPAPDAGGPAEVWVAIKSEITRLRLSLEGVNPRVCTCGGVAIYQGGQ